VIDRHGPGCSIKGKLGISATFWHRRQLEEVASNDKLNATPRSTVVPKNPPDLRQLVEEITINHGDFVNNQDLGLQPPGLGFEVTSNLLDQRVDILLSETNTRKAVQCDTTNIAGS